MIPNRFYKKRCFFTKHSRCFVKGNYRECKMMMEILPDMFIVPDNRPIYDAQECKHFLWRIK